MISDDTRKNGALSRSDDSLAAHTIKNPRFCRADRLDPGFIQVGAIMKSSGFPVQSGHAHPFQKIAPFNFFSRGTSYINHAQSRGLFYLFCMYIYQNQGKMARIKKVVDRRAGRENACFQQFTGWTETGKPPVPAV